MRLDVRMLGDFAVSIDGEDVPSEAWAQRRGAELVKLLGLADHHRLARQQVTAALWPDLAGEAGAANVRKAAHRARQSLGLDDGIVLDGGTVHLAPDHDVATDVADFRVAATDALAEGDVDGCRDAARRYGGELLPGDRYADWCADERRRLHRLYLQVLAGGQLWGRLVDVAPTDERAHREIMTAQLERGDRAAALRQFQQVRETLRKRLGLSPGPEIVAVYERALAMEGPDTPTPRERARSLLAWGVVHWERSELAEVERTAIEARALAIDAGLGPELTDASELLGLVAFAQGNWHELFGREYVETVRRHPDLAPFVHDAHMCMCEFALHEADGVHTVGALGRDLLDAGETDGHAQARAVGLLLCGEVTLVSSAEAARASDDLDEAARLHEQASSLTGACLAVERRAQVAQAVGDTGSARQLHRRALGLARESPATRHLVPFVYGGMLEALDASEGAQVVAEARRAVGELDACDPCSLHLHAWTARILARVGDLDTARDHLVEAERIVAMWDAGPPHHAVAEATAAILIAVGDDPAEARALLSDAASGYAAAHRPRDVARCRAAVAALD